MAQSQTLSTALTITLALSSTMACGGASDQPSSAPYLRSDSPELDLAWPATLPLYEAAHQNEQAVVQALELDPSTRGFVMDNMNRLSFVTHTGSVSVFYDEGPDQPFHTLSYQRSAPFQPQTWSGSAELRSKWEAGARIAAEYLHKLTQLTPVVSVGRATDVDYAAALTDGYQFLLATNFAADGSIEHRLVWVDDLEVRVDASGLAEFTTDELVFTATPSGLVDCMTPTEVDAIIAGGEYKARDPKLPPPIFYGFDTDAAKLTPYYLAAGTGESGPLAIPLGRP
jgi:hypothetical protein